MTQKKPIRILVADDNDDLRSLIIGHFSIREFEVIEATNGQEAVAAATRVVPDLIMMDLQMPVMDGINATRQIRQRDELRDVPIIFFSAHGAEGMDLFIKIDTLGTAPIEYLAKPFDIDDLSSLVQSLMSRDK